MRRVESSIHLVAEPASAGQARRFVAGTLASWGADGAVESVELLVSELVTNSVLHAGTPVDLTLACENGLLHVEVHDDSPAIPRPRRFHAEAATGRGLRLVESIATRWGVEKVPDDGKVVWFDLDTSVFAAGPDPVSFAEPDLDAWGDL